MKEIRVATSEGLAADRFRGEGLSMSVTEGGALIVASDEATAIYAPGHWQAAFEGAFR